MTEEPFFATRKNTNCGLQQGTHFARLLDKQYNPLGQYLNTSLRVPYTDPNKIHQYLCDVFNGTRELLVAPEVESYIEEIKENPGLAFNPTCKWHNVKVKHTVPPHEQLPLPTQRRGENYSAAIDQQREINKQRILLYFEAIDSQVRSTLREWPICSNGGIVNLHLGHWRCTCQK